MSKKNRCSMAATVMVCTFALTGLGQTNSAQAGETAMHGDQGVASTAATFGGAILAVGLLGNLVGHAAMKASDTHTLKDCISSDSSAPLPPTKLEIRKQVLQPIRQVTHKPAGPTYHLAQD